MATATDHLQPAPGLVPTYSDLIGKPFEWGARGPDRFDCYGLVQELLARVGVDAPDQNSPTVHEQIAQLVMTVTGGESWWAPCEPGPGAVITFRLGRHVSHVGLALPYGKFIHSWDRSGGVCVERIEHWQHRIAGYYRQKQ